MSNSAQLVFNPVQLLQMSSAVFIGGAMLVWLIWAFRQLNSAHPEDDKPIIGLQVIFIIVMMVAAPIAFSATQTAFP